jgi:hypothetical protein
MSNCVIKRKEDGSVDRVYNPIILKQNKEVYDKLTNSLEKIANKKVFLAKDIKAYSKNTPIVSKAGIIMGYQTQDTMYLREDVYDFRPSVRDIFGIDMDIPLNSVLAKAANAQFQIVGEKAASNLDQIQETTARLDNLLTAKELDKQGITPKEIRLLTGWEKNQVDSKWRYEIQDGTFSSVDVNFDSNNELFDNKVSVVKVGDLYNNNELFEAYPQLKDTNVYVYETTNLLDENKMFTYNGELYVNKKDYINKDGKFEIRDGSREAGELLHEFQHLVQAIEGFGRGSSRQNNIKEIERAVDFIRNGNEEVDNRTEEQKRYDRFFKSAFEEQVEKGREKLEDNNISPTIVANFFAQRMYESYSGEVEARNVANRYSLTPQERLSTLLEQTQDIPYDKQFLDYSDNTNALGEQTTELQLTEAVQQQLQKAGLVNNFYLMSNTEIEAKLKEFGYNDEIVRQVVAYHGSPHSFDRFEFSDRTFLSGEKAAAFGAGLYFTDLESIARGYAKNLSTLKFKGQDISQVEFFDILFTGLDASNSDFYDYQNGRIHNLKEFKNYVDDNVDYLSNLEINEKTPSVNRLLQDYEYRDEKIKEAKESLKYYKSTDFTTLADKLVEAGVDDATAKSLAEDAKRRSERDKVYLRNAIKYLASRETTLSKIIEGEKRRTKSALNYFKFIQNNFDKIEMARNLYKVTLHKGKTPDQYTWLEWDKPVSESVISKLENSISSKQKEKILNFSNKNGSKGFRSKEFRDNNVGWINPSGKSIYTNLSQELGGDKQASLFLLENGIDGIKFPAESISRGATSDTARGFNYVVFDENAITIEEQIQFSQTIYPQFQIIGEKGAENVKEYQDKLNEAKELEKNNTSYNEIEARTGWYKYKGSWKMLSPEVIKDFNIVESLDKNRVYNLNEVIKNENIIFKIYPKIGEYKVVFVDTTQQNILQNTPKNIENLHGAYDETSGTIFINTTYEGVEKDISQQTYTLAHEVSHVIQEIEGFPKGGDSKSILREAISILKIEPKTDSFINIYEKIKTADKNSLTENERNIVNTSLKTIEYIIQKNDSALAKQYRNILGEIDANIVEGALKIRDNQEVITTSYLELLTYYKKAYNIDENTIYLLSNGDVRFSVSGEKSVEEAISKPKGIKVTTNGFYFNGDVYVNQESSNPLETLLHEYSHAYIDKLETERPDLFQRGVELVKSEDAREIVEYVKFNQPQLKEDSRKFAKEVLAEISGRRATELLLGKESEVRIWLQEFFKWLKSMLNIYELSSIELANLTLGEYSQLIGVAMLNSDNILEGLINISIIEREC